MLPSFGAKADTRNCSLTETEMMDNITIVRRRLRIRNDLLRCLLAEFISTAILMFGGTASTAPFILTHGEYNRLCVAVGWGVAVGLGALTARRISGGHMNPAVSFAIYLCGGLSAYRFMLYSIVQIAGGFVGSLITFLLYYDGINNFDNGVRQIVGPQATLGIFVPWPQDYLSIGGCIFDEFWGTAFLCFCVAMIGDPRNEIPAVAQPMLVSFTITLIGICDSLNSGYEINPARDLGPKLMALCVGYGWGVVSYRNYTWFPIPIFVPLIGAAFGTWLYHLTIGIHILDDEEDDTLEQIENQIEFTEESRRSTRFSE